MATSVPGSVPLPTGKPVYLVPNTKVDYEKLNEFQFTPPPNCPVYYPTPEEFAMGPLDYIAKIRPKAEKFGICKIVPPKSYLVPFAIDINKFHFSPRNQRLNELEALTRIKLSFHERVYKFWDYQGVCLRFPTLEKKILDLYMFHSIVKEEGGFETCMKDKKWSKIATRMNLSKSSAAFLRQYYEKILFPYDIFLSGATTGPEIHAHVANMDIKVNGNGTTNGIKLETKQEIEQIENADPQHSELRKLQTYGAGPKMPGFMCEDNIPKGRYCHNCNAANNLASLLTCKNCQKSFHKGCLIPPFNDTPKNQWHCHPCLSILLAQHPMHYIKDYGFFTSNKTYSLAQFGEMADNYKSEYFNSPPYEVPLETVEKEFWRIVTSFEGSVNVEYGADLHTVDYGSGFPTTSSKFLPESDKDYIDSPWNLNNLPTLDGSVFKHIPCNINGMIIPWMYVGMCFSAFCWHNEDHWTYSINYLHWGEPKIWYGVPGDQAEVFEKAMRLIAPELFSSQPDLLHQLVTTCNPNILADHGVPITKATQNAGEFIVTFPRSYHSGFNQGLNFAEAVNFASFDWLPIGRLSVSHYASLHRFPVFSHDELICKMADERKDLESRLATATYADVLRMVNAEKSLRIKALADGVADSGRDTLEFLKDDERQCDYCHTTCFLSCVRCKCDKSKMVCLYHYDYLCDTCSYGDCIVYFRYSVDELTIMSNELNDYIGAYKDWADKAENALKGLKKRQRYVNIKNY